MATPQSEGFAHALVELSKQGELLAAIDTREVEHFRQIAERLGQFGDGLTAVESLVRGQRDVLEALTTQVHDLSATGSSDEDDDKAKPYRPTPAPRWWNLEGDVRDEALNRLRGWVEQIYRPMYGHLAALGPCWPHHPLCLMTLDWLSELWSVLYLPKYRTASMLAGQAEFQTRLLPAASEQLATETARCEHAQPRNGQPRSVVSR